MHFLTLKTLCHPSKIKLLPQSASAREEFLGITLQIRHLGHQDRPDSDSILYLAQKAYALLEPAVQQAHTELIQTIDRNAHPIAQIPRIINHFSLLHSFGGFVVLSQKDWIYMQLRSDKVTAYPLRWDMSAGGALHSMDYRDIRKTVVRELFEEIFDHHHPDEALVEELADHLEIINTPKRWYRNNHNAVRIVLFHLSAEYLASQKIRLGKEAKKLRRFTIENALMIPRSLITPWAHDALHNALK